MGCPAVLRDKLALMAPGSRDSMGSCDDIYFSLVSTAVLHLLCNSYDRPPRSLLNIINMFLSFNFTFNVRDSL